MHKMCFSFCKVMTLLIGCVVGVSATSADSTKQQPANLAAFVSIGADFARGSTFLDSSQTFGSDNVTRTSVKDLYYNLGRGLSLSAGLDLKLIGRLGLHPFVDSRWVLSRMKAVTSSPAYSNTDTYKAYTLGLGSTLRPYFNIFDFMTCYIGAGVGIYFSGVRIIGSNATTNSDNGSINVYPAFALLGEAGASLPITKSISAFANFEFTDMSFKVRKTKSTFNTSPEKTYVKSSVSDPAPFRISGSTLGIHLGVSYNLK